MGFYGVYVGLGSFGAGRCQDLDGGGSVGLSVVS